MIVIYRHWCQISGLSYIGQTKRDLVRRWKEHQRRADAGSAYAFHRAIRKYGSDVWTHELLENCQSQEEANLAEEHWIAHFDSYRNGYNETVGGRVQGTTAGSVLSFQTKQKISVSSKGKSRNAGEKNPFFGLRHNEAYSHLMSKRMKGEANPRSKITPEDVLTIRAMYANGSLQREIAATFGLKQAYVSSIILKKAWKHV